MAEAADVFRMVAGLLFWGLADVVLAVVWGLLIGSLIYAVIRSPKE